MSDNDPDRDTPTPRESGSYLMFAHMAQELAVRLETRSLVLRRHPLMTDLAGAKECDDLVRELRSLACDFAQWPRLSHELVAISRSTQVPRLLELQRLTEEILARTAPR